MFIDGGVVAHCMSVVDSLEVIDSDRIADLVEYFEAYVGCLVVALLPEDVNAPSEEHHYITEV